MRLFDRLTMNGFTPTVPADPGLTAKMRRLSRQWMSELRKAAPVVYLIDNVANYYFEGTTDSRDIVKGDFPCLAPPWPLVFMEFASPSKILCNDGVEAFDSDQMGRRFGVLLESAEPGHSSGFHGLSGFDLLPGIPQEWLNKHIEGVRWLQQASLFAELDKERIVLTGTFLWSIDAEGRFNFPVDEYGGLSFLPPFGANLDDEYRQSLGHNCWCFIN